MPYPWKFSYNYYRHSLDTLEKALRELPAYHSWRAYDPGAELTIDNRYQAMPLLTKGDIRRHFPHGFVPTDRDLQYGLDSGEISFVDTSGATDDKVTNIWNQKWWNASERASWKLNSYAARLPLGEHPEAILVNPLNVGIASDDIDLPMEKRLCSRFLYLNEKTQLSLWTLPHMDRMVKELADFKPAILEANPSYLAKLCRYIIKNKQTAFQPGLIILTYENPSEFHCRQIRQVFNAPIASSYGTTETGYVFMQCEAGKFHQNSESCRVDFQPFKKEHGGPLLGRILVTTFNNPWYYLIRFDVGDLVRIDEKGKCACGRDSGIILSATEGRFVNATLTCTGRLVSFRELDNCLSAIEGADEYRLDQVTFDSYELKLVSQLQDKQKLKETAISILKKLYGERANVTIAFKEAISPESSGKYRLSRALFPLNINDYLEESLNPVKPVPN